MAIVAPFAKLTLNQAYKAEPVAETCVLEILQTYLQIVLLRECKKTGSCVSGLSWLVKGGRLAKASFTREVTTPKLYSLAIHKVSPRLKLDHVLFIRSLFVHIYIYAGTYFLNSTFVEKKTKAKKKIKTKRRTTMNLMFEHQGWGLGEFCARNWNQPRLIKFLIMPSSAIRANKN